MLEWMRTLVAGEYYLRILQQLARMMFLIKLYEWNVQFNLIKMKFVLRSNHVTKGVVLFVDGEHDGVGHLQISLNRDSNQSETLFSKLDKLTLIV
jgi:hypothetical protein